MASPSSDIPASYLMKCLRALESLEASALSLTYVASARLETKSGSISGMVYIKRHAEESRRRPKKISANTVSIPRRIPYSETVPYTPLFLRASKRSKRK